MNAHHRVGIIVAVLWTLNTHSVDLDRRVGGTFLTNLQVSIVNFSVCALRADLGSLVPIVRSFTGKALFTILIWLVIGAFALLSIIVVSRV